MEFTTETYGEYTLLSNSHASTANPQQYTATCIIKKEGKILDRVSINELFSSAHEANEKARSPAKQRVGAWWRSS
jgi:hypothetical protein